MHPGGMSFRCCQTECGAKHKYSRFPLLFCFESSLFCVFQLEHLPIPSESTSSSLSSLSANSKTYQFTILATKKPPHKSRCASFPAQRSTTVVTTSKKFTSHLVPYQDILITMAMATATAIAHPTPLLRERQRDLSVVEQFMLSSQE